MLKDVKLFCNLCEICKKNKSYNAPQVPILKHPEVSAVFDRLHIDLIGPLPCSQKKNQYILTAVDAFSRFARCVPIRDKKMQTVARAIVNEVFCVYGVPNILYSDRGLEFTGHQFKAAVKELGVKQNFTTAFNPASNGLVERFNRSLVEILRCLVYEQPLSWDESVHLACFAYNSSYNHSIRESPHFIFFLRDPRLPYKKLLDTKISNADVTDYKTEMVKRASDVFRICKAYSENQLLDRNVNKNVGRKLRNIKVGDRIFLKTNIRTNKFVPKFNGPFRVVGVKGTTVFCYSLLSKKHKKVDMGKCRLVSDLSEEDAKISAFPEDESVDDDDVGDSVNEETDDVDSSNHDRVPTPVRSVPSDVTDVAQIQVDRGGGRRNPKVPSVVQNRYNLRSKL